MTTSQGALAKRDVMLHLLATVKAEVADLSRIAPTGVVVLVNSTPEFDEQHLVANGATDLLIGIFGDERGRPARTAMGVSGHQEVPLVALQQLMCAAVDPETSPGTSMRHAAVLCCV